LAVDALPWFWEELKIGRMVPIMVELKFRSSDVETPP